MSGIVTVILRRGSSVSISVERAGLKEEVGLRVKDAKRLYLEIVICGLSRCAFLYGHFPLLQP